MQARKNTKTFNEPCNLSSNEVEKNPKKLEVKYSEYRRSSFNKALDRCRTIKLTG